MNLTNLMRVFPLLGLNFVEMAVSFGRMFILTHILNRLEFGLAAALSVTYATFEQITDISIHRFAFASPRSIYDEAVSAAHAFAILRGFCVGGIAFMAAAPMACLFSTCDSWLGFSWLGLVILIRSFENMQIKVAERDYRYGPQFIASIASHACGLVALTIAAYGTRSHDSFIVYLVTQACVYVLASHLLASSRYQVNFRTPQFKRALRFGFPFMINGIGLAVMSGDRMMVGAFLGPTILGLYAIAVLAAFVPLGGLNKMLHPIMLAGIHNAPRDSAIYIARLKLFSRAIPAIAACYAVFLLASLQILVPLLFSGKYALSELSVELLALRTFFLLSRSEPHTSLLINSQNTHLLAIANLTPLSGLLFATILTIAYRSMESTLIGLLIGDLIAGCVITFLTRHLLMLAMRDYVSSLFVMSIIVFAAIIASRLAQSAEYHVSNSTIAGAFLISILAYAIICFPRLYRDAYDTPN